MIVDNLKNLQRNLPRLLVMGGWLVLIGIVLWSYTPVFARLVNYWSGPDYQHGFLVPVFCLVLLLVRGEQICGQSQNGDWWLNLLWSGKAWFSALLRSETAWIGVIVGAALAAPLYAFHFHAFYRPDVPKAGWGEIVAAACYGGILGALILLVAELFRHSDDEPRRLFGWTWWALPFLAAWAVLRLVAACFVVERFDEWSLMPFAAGLALVAGGWAALRWAWPSIVFMYFMTPLPGSVQDRLGPFLQKIGTLASIYLIQAMSIPAVRRGADGNVIQLPGAQLGVAEACSGIRMLMLFFAICVGAAFVLRCPLWKKAVIVVSAVPIAVFSNVIRITVTAVLYELSRRWPTRISEDAAKWLFHDGAGLLMMPLAMVLVFILWHLLGRLVVEEAPEGPLALGSSLSQGRPAGKPQSNSKP